VNDEGEPLYRFYNQARPRGICWEAATDADFVSKGKAQAKTAMIFIACFP